jgi:hypothetical protein
VTNEFFAPSLDDSGRVAFVVQLEGIAGSSAYVWEYGANIPALISGTALPSGARITNVSHAWLNGRDRSVLIAATTNRRQSSQYGLYRVFDGRITPVVEPGGVMPGGGTLQTVQWTAIAENAPPLMGVSEANAAGQYAFLATLSDGSAGAYRLDPDGTLTLLFRTDLAPLVSMAPDLEFVPGSRPCLNNQGQIDLSMRSPSHDSVIVLLTLLPPSDGS